MRDDSTYLAVQDKKTLVSKDSKGVEISQASMYGVVAPFIYLQSLTDGHILPSCHGLGCSKDKNEINLYPVLVQLFDQYIHSGEERERGKGPIIVTVIYRNRSSI